MRLRRFSMVPVLGAALCGAPAGAHTNLSARLPLLHRVLSDVVGPSRAERLFPAAALAPDLGHELLERKLSNFFYRLTLPDRDVAALAGSQRYVLGTLGESLAVSRMQRKLLEQGVTDWIYESEYELSKTKMDRARLPDGIFARVDAGRLVLLSVVESKFNKSRLDLDQLSEFLQLVREHGLGVQGHHYAGEDIYVAHRGTLVPLRAVALESKVDAFVHVFMNNFTSEIDRVVPEWLEYGAVPLRQSDAYAVFERLLTEVPRSSETTAMRSAYARRLSAYVAQMQVVEDFRGTDHVRFVPQQESWWAQNNFSGRDELVDLLVAEKLVPLGNERLRTALRALQREFHAAEGTQRAAFWIGQSHITARIDANWARAREYVAELRMVEDFAGNSWLWLPTGPPQSRMRQLSDWAQQFGGYVAIVRWLAEGTGAAAALDENIRASAQALLVAYEATPPLERAKFFIGYGNRLEQMALMRTRAAEYAALIEVVELADGTRELALPGGKRTQWNRKQFSSQLDLLLWLSSGRGIAAQVPAEVARLAGEWANRLLPLSERQRGREISNLGIRVARFRKGKCGTNLAD